MSTHLPGLQSFFSFFHHFVLANLATAACVKTWFNHTLTYIDLLHTKDITILCQATSGRDVTTE